MECWQWAAARVWEPGACCMVERSWPCFPIAACRQEPNAPSVRVPLRSQPCIPVMGGFRCHKWCLCFREPLWCDGPQNHAESYLKPKASSVLPSCATLPLLPSGCARPQLGGLPSEDMAEGQWGLSLLFTSFTLNLSMAASQAVHSPGPHLLLPPSFCFPMRLCGLWLHVWALQGCPALAARFLQAAGVAHSPLNVGGWTPMWQLSGWWGAASRARSLPWGSCRNKCPLRAGSWKALVPATGAAEAKTPWLWTISWGKPWLLAGIHLWWLPLLNAAGSLSQSATWLVRCQQLQQAPGGSSSRWARVFASSWALGRALCGEKLLVWPSQVQPPQKMPLSPPWGPPLMQNLACGPGWGMFPCPRDAYQSWEFPGGNFFVK